MSVGSWSPEGDKAKSGLSIDPVWLERFIAFSANDQLDEIDRLIDPQDQQVQSGLMAMSKENWIKAADSLSDDAVIHLIRFFTVAEMKLAGWEAGNESPVIGLTKALKQRGVTLDKELLKWIKANSDNRFLPHGSVL